MTDSPQPNHEPAALSTAGASESAPSASELANRVIYRPGLRGGHVESLFLKGNSPDGERALWIKSTLLAPSGGGAPAVEVWAIAFDRGRPGFPRANKRSYPLERARIRDQPFELGAPDALFRHGAAEGQLGFDERGGPKLRWDLRFPCPAQEFRPFPSARMYTGPFPRTKTLTPVPDTRLSGFFEVDGERWDVAGFRAAQGHNWGKGHAHAYAWAHSNALRPTNAQGSSPAHPRERFADETWLEVISGRVRVGPLLTPWLTSAAICVDGALHRFDGPRALLSRSVESDLRSFRFTLRQGDAQLRARFWTEASEMAGLTYRDPDGKELACLNSKLAHGEVALTVRGRTWSFETEQAALELGTRRHDHGVTMLA